MDMWGLCPSCETWFACRDWFDRSAPEPTCPSCDLAPVALENRTLVIRVPAEDAATA